MGNVPGPVLDDRTKKTGLSITREIDETGGQSEQSGERIDVMGSVPEISCLTVRCFQDGTMFRGKYTTREKRRCRPARDRSGPASRPGCLRAPLSGAV